AQFALHLRTTQPGVKPAEDFRSNALVRLDPLVRPPDSCDPGCNPEKDPLSEVKSVQDGRPMYLGAMPAGIPAWRQFSSEPRWLEKESFRPGDLQSARCACRVTATDRRTSAHCKRARHRVRFPCPHGYPVRHPWIVRVVSVLPPRFHPLSEIVWFRTLWVARRA